MYTTQERPKRAGLADLRLSQGLKLLAEAGNTHTVKRAPDFARDGHHCVVFLTHLFASHFLITHGHVQGTYGV
jgi:hypothetical protein